jgi:hypothetical protein
MDIFIISEIPNIYQFLKIILKCVLNDVECTFLSYTKKPYNLSYNEMLYYVDRLPNLKLFAFLG